MIDTSLDLRRRMRVRSVREIMLGGQPTKPTLTDEQIEARSTVEVVTDEGVQPVGYLSPLTDLDPRELDLETVRVGWRRGQYNVYLQSRDEPSLRDYLKQAFSKR